MSLINEALKRAQADKAREPYAPPPWGPLSPSPVESSGPAPKRAAGLWVMLGFLLVGVSVFWMVRKTLPEMFGPAGAPAAVNIAPAKEAASPAAKPASVPVPTAAPAAADPAIAELRNELARLTRKIDLPPVAQLPDPTTRPASPSFSLASEEAPTPQPPAKKAPTPLAVPAAAAKAPAATASVATPPPPATTNPPALKLSGIICGPDGGTAIINGQMLRVGQEIAGARVVRIDPCEVHLEFAGTPLRLRM